MRQAVKLPEALVISVGFPLRGCAFSCAGLPTWAYSGYSPKDISPHKQLTEGRCEIRHGGRENENKYMCFTLNSA